MYSSAGKPTALQTRQKRWHRRLTQYTKKTEYADELKKSRRKADNEMKRGLQAGPPFEPKLSPAVHNTQS